MFTNINDNDSCIGSLYKYVAFKQNNHHLSYPSLQLSSVFGKWLSDVRSNTASTITSSDLQSLGEMLCGATTTQLGAISAAVYKAAAAKVGTVTMCAESQLQVLAATAKDAAAFGSNVSVWDASTVAAVGNVIGA